MKTTDPLYLPYSGSFAYCGQLAADAREAVSLALLILGEACTGSNQAAKLADLSAVRYWNEVAQSARKVLVYWGQLPSETL